MACGDAWLSDGLDLMEHYVRAIRKVLADNLEELADLAAKRPDQ